MFGNVLRALGNERLYKYVEQNDNMEIFGAFALTEISHGTNARGMRTTGEFFLYKTLTIESKRKSDESEDLFIPWPFKLVPLAKEKC